MGAVIRGVRVKNSANSLNKFAREYDFDCGNFSKLENGAICCRLITAWKIAEASEMKFSEFAKLLEEKLGDNFKLIEEYK